MNVYKTDTKKLTCSCPNWVESRIKYSISDPRRLCKHIINQLNINELPNEIKRYKASIKFYQDKEKGYRLFDKQIMIPDTDLVAEYVDGDWINIYDNEANKYGLLVLDENYIWAQSTKPKNYKAVEIFFASREYQLVAPLTDIEIKSIEEKLDSKFKIESGNFVITTQERPYEIIAKDINAETYYDQMYITNETIFIEAQEEKYIFDRDQELIETLIDKMVQSKLPKI